MRPVDFVERVVMYGTPEDCFVRVVDTFALCGCGLHAVWTSQRVTARWPVDSLAMLADVECLEAKEM